jgi:hypothetical protein
MDEVAERLCPALELARATRAELEKKKAAEKKAEEETAKKKAEEKASRP